MSDREVSSARADSKARTSVPTSPRPSRVQVDPDVCGGFGICLAMAPDILLGPACLPLSADESNANQPASVRVAPRAQYPARGAVLDAMEACPTGAIRWVELEQARPGEDAS